MESAESVLINSLSEIEDFVALFQEPLDKRRLLALFESRAGHEKDLLLLVLHSLNIPRQACQFTGGRSETEQLGQSGPVGGIFDHSQFDVCGEFSPECRVKLLVDLFDHV